MTGQTAKEDTILEAATRLFLKHGFGGTSMEAVAREAGTAKQTVYNHFASKEALFNAIVRGRCTALFDEIPAGNGNQEDIEAYLTILARRVMDMLFTNETLELYRLVLAQTPRFPELGRTYYQNGPKAAVETLASFFENHGVENGRALIFAEQFFGMLTGHLLTKALLNKNAKPTSEEKDRHVSTTIPLFVALLSES